MKERYYFFLSPYIDCAFTRCPKCGSLTKQKKIPLFMHLEREKQFISLNKFCRFCPCCELLIAKKQEIMDFLKQYLQSDHIDDKDYFIFGTQDRADWLQCTNGVQEKTRRDTVFAFKDVLTFEPAGGWRKDTTDNK